MKKTQNSLHELANYFASMSEKIFNTEGGKELIKLREENLHQINAINVLKNAIQAAMNDPAMTPEVKDAADLFILLLEETGNSFKYDADAVIQPVVKLARSEIPSKGGKQRAKNDKRTAILKEIEAAAISNASKFKIRGYQAEFVRNMLKIYGVENHKNGLSEDKAILNHLSELKKRD